MKPELLLMTPLFSITMETLEHHFTVHRYWEADDPSALLQSISADVTAVVTDGGRGAEASILSQLPGVKLVAVFGVGVDAVALDYCKQQGIKVSNTPDVLSDDVADLAVALILAVSRRVVLADRYCRSGLWSSQGPMPLTTRVSGKRAGIFGMGSIGLRLAQRLSAFDMQVNYCNRSRRSDVNYQFVADLKNLAAEVDYLVVAASASASTNNIINAEVLSALGNEGYLINVSRGSLVDETALLHALKHDEIKGAALDVFDNEPSINPEFLSLENVVLQPHQASATFETRKAMGQVVIDNLDCFFTERPLVTEFFIRS